MRERAWGIDNERGATIALVAISMAVVLGMGALAVDMGMLLKVRGDAQRAADAAALAGASAFIDNGVPADAMTPARDRALEFAAKNYVGGTWVDTTGAVQTTSGVNVKTETEEATVIVKPNERRVRVIVRRAAVGTLFARVLGFANVPIAAMAEAEASEAGGAKCVKPFALPDMWADVDDDANNNRLWDNGEDWDYDPNSDQYRPWQGDPTKYGNINETGYGSGWRNSSVGADGKSYTDDWGRPIAIKPQDPNTDGVIKPGIFYPWDMPADPTQVINCGNGGGLNGASGYSKNICSCNNSQVQLGVDYPIKTGNMQGPTRFGVQDLVDLDKNAQWNPNQTGEADAVTGSKYANWWDSPRVIKIALWDPVEVQKSGKQYIKFTNIALLFIESYNKKDDAVIARFLTYAQGSAPEGPNTGTLIRTLRLVK